MFFCNFKIGFFQYFENSRYEILFVNQSQLQNFENFPLNTRFSHKIQGFGKSVMLVNA